MLKVVVAFVSGLVLVSCGTKNSSEESQVMSVGTSRLHVDCVRNDEARNITLINHMILKISGQSVSVERRILRKDGQSEQFANQIIQGTINKVFDFNSVSQNSAQVLLNPTSVKTTINGKVTEEKLPYVFVEFSQGRLKITERDAKVLMSHSICRTLP